MTLPSERTETSFEVIAESRRSPRTIEEEIFVLIVLGDFSGRFLRRLEPQGMCMPSQRCHWVDRDSFHAVLKRIHPVVPIDTGLPSDGEIQLAVESLDDFHPDRLYETLPLFLQLRSLRRELDNPKTYETALKRIRQLALDGSEGGQDGSQIPESPPSPAGEAQRRDPSSQSVLEQMLEEAEPETGRSALEGAGGGWRRVLSAWVRPYQVSKKDGTQLRAERWLNETTASLLRAILHNRAFQYLEALWRGLKLLTDGFHSDDSVRVLLVDLSPNELAGEFAPAQGDPPNIVHTIVDQLKLLGRSTLPAGIFGCYAFGENPADLRVLGRLAKTCTELRVPLLVEGHPRLLGCHRVQDLATPSTWNENEDKGLLKAWTDLRRDASSLFMGLLLPRILLRYPYGSSFVETDSLEFEEFLEFPEHEAYLWGSPVWIPALLTARGLSTQGNTYRPGTLMALDGLPFVVYKQNGQPRVQPCTEVLLSERTCQAIMEKGLMPVAGYADRDRVRLLRFQSAAQPATPLPWPWS